jgi:hypothetical protein
MSEFGIVDWQVFVVSAAIAAYFVLIVCLNEFYYIETLKDWVDRFLNVLGLLLLVGILIMLIVDTFLLITR